MAIPVWPASLPQALITDGYGQQAPNTIIATQMDVGPGKRRRRTSAGVQPVQGQIVVTEAQLDTLRTFFRTSLGNGALRFRWVDPVSSPDPVGDARMVLDGSAGTYASTPHSAAVDITGDLTLVAKIEVGVWAGGASQFIAAKAQTEANRSWTLRIDPNGDLRMLVADASAENQPGFPLSHSFKDKEPVWLAVVLRLDNGAGNSEANYYTSTDGDTWQSIGAALRVPLESLRSTSAPFSVMALGNGAGAVGGKVYRMRLYDGAGFDLNSGPTGTLVADFNPSDAPRSLSGGGNFTSSTTGEVWTLHGNATIHNPTVGVPVEMRFTEPPQWSARTSGIYTVSLALEILP